MFNATPAVAVLGAWGIVALWNKANWQGLVRTWKKFGIRTPADRIAEQGEQFGELHLSPQYY